MSFEEDQNTVEYRPFKYTVRVTETEKHILENIAEERCANNIAKTIRLLIGKGIKTFSLTQKINSLLNAVKRMYEIFKSGVMNGNIVVSEAEFAEIMNFKQLMEDGK